MSDKITAQPSEIIDALIKYAIDPLQWEAFAQELDKDGDALKNLDSSTFLAALSEAESLAWRLRGQPTQTANHTHCIFYLLDSLGVVIESSGSRNALQGFCEIMDNNLRFSAQDSQHSFNLALETMRRGHQQEILIELKSESENSRYGYLVGAKNLPAAFNVDSDVISYGFLIAEAGSNEHASSVLQSSFNLTSAEVAICELLHSGLQLKEIASELNISTNTARNHLQAVFDKTHVNRQGELILMMTQLSVILSVIESDQPAHQDLATAYPNHEFCIIATEAVPRRVAYRCYGTGPRYVIYFHESVGSSRLLPGTHTLADKFGLTIIAFERPGTGFSDPMDGTSYQTTALDLEILLNELGIEEEVSLLGFLSGTSHALAAAARLGSRVNKVMLIAGRSSAGFSANDNSPLAVLRRRLADHPWLLSTACNILRSRANHDINRGLLMRIYGAVEHDRQLMIESPEILEHMVGCSLESLTVSGRGVADDILCSINPVAINLNAVRAPIVAWHGEQDTLASFDNLARELGGLDFSSRLFPDCGSLIFLEYWQEILAYLGDANSI